LENISLLTAPPLSQDGFGELLEQREAAGYQRDKRRGTFQSTTLNKIVTRAILEDEKLEELDEQGGKPSPTRQRTHTHTHRGYTHNLTHTRPHAPAPRASQCTPCLRACQ